MKTFCLILSGIIFTVVSTIHFVRYFKGWEIVFDHFKVPLDWSIYGGIATALFAFIMFVAAAKRD